MKRRKFTLIELLVVIAIIGILMGILLPVLSSVKTKGKEVKAKTDINSIVTACKQYESDYGVLPAIDTADVALATATSSAPLKTAPSTDAKYNALFQILTGVTYQTSTAAIYNVRNIKYLEVPNTYATLGYIDPWGASYGIAMDLGYNGSITLANPMSGTTLNAPIAVWSRGNTSGSFNTSEATTKYLMSWK